MCTILTPIFDFMNVSENSAVYVMEWLAMDSGFHSNLTCDVSIQYF